LEMFFNLPGSRPRFNDNFDMAWDAPLDARFEPSVLSDVGDIGAGENIYEDVQEFLLAVTNLPIRRIGQKSLDPSPT
jgi:hypothetical protein